MDESRLVAPDTTRRESGSLASLSEIAEATSVGRLLEERPTHIHDGESARANMNERLLFWVDGTTYSASLREALPMLPQVASLPFSPPWLLGVFQLRTDLVALIDARPVLGDDLGVGGNGGQIALRGGEQALLIGEAGRLIAFVVDRLGDLVSLSGAASPARDVKGAGLGAPVRYMEGSHPLAGDGHEVAIALDLSALYEDVIGKLEVWSRDA